MTAYIRRGIKIYKISCDNMNKKSSFTLRVENKQFHRIPFFSSRVKILQVHNKTNKKNLDQN